MGRRYSPPNTPPQVILWTLRKLLTDFCYRYSGAPQPGRLKIIHQSTINTSSIALHPERVPLKACVAVRVGERISRCGSAPNILGHTPSHIAADKRKRTHLHRYTEYIPIIPRTPPEYQLIRSRVYFVPNGLQSTSKIDVDFDFVFGASQATMPMCSRVDVVARCYICSQLSGICLHLLTRPMTSCDFTHFSVHFSSVLFICYVVL